MKMQRAHFLFIANQIRADRPRPFDLEMRPSESVIVNNILDGLSEAFADRLAETNNDFDRERFLKACGVE